MHSQEFEVGSVRQSLRSRLCAQNGQSQNWEIMLLSAFCPGPGYVGAGEHSVHISQHICIGHETRAGDPTTAGHQFKNSNPVMNTKKLCTVIRRPRQRHPHVRSLIAPSILCGVYMREMLNNARRRRRCTRKLWRFATHASTGPVAACARSTRLRVRSPQNFSGGPGRAGRLGRAVVELKLPRPLRSYRIAAAALGVCDSSFPHQHGCLR